MVTAWSSDQLADWLGDWLADAPPDPFAQELVVVPTPGLETYLTRRLARRLGAGVASDGVAAGIRFTHPSDLVAEVAAGILGGETDPWAPQSLRWLVLAALDGIVAEPAQWAEPVRGYLERSPGRDRRLALARESAGLLTNYALQRPALIEDWAAGRQQDGAGNPLGAGHVWQYHLFAGVLEAAGTLPWPVRLRGALGSAAIGDGLPPRLAVFGPSRLSELDSAVLSALAASREVVVCTVRHTDRRGGGCRLVQSLGQEEATGLRWVEQAADESVALPGGPAAHGILGSIQQSVAQGRELAGTGPATTPGSPSGTDRSVSVHSCAGDLRQVEALRDEVLHLMSADRSLQPRDVLVMCTDLERFGPLIAEVFGTSAAPVAGATRDLRVRIADRIARTANPVLGTVLEFVTLLSGRMTATAVTDFLATPRVAARFGLTDEEVERLTGLVARASVRWGLDARHRAENGAPAGAANTWQTGLDRLALGLAVDGSEAGLVGGVAPAEALGDRDGVAVAALMALVDTLDAAREFCWKARPAPEWASRLSEWANTFSGDSSWELAAAVSTLNGLFAGADRSTELSLPEVIGLVTDAATGYAPLPDLLAGGVAVAEMRPMRNIPFRVICLVGMDDGSIPRSVSLGGNDILAVAPQPGERDPRAEDRQLFLDALCAARSHLVITYSGFHPVSGKPLPPAAPLAELLSVLGAAGAGAVLRECPLTPFDPANFADGALGWPGPYSHDAAAAAAASVAPQAPAIATPPPPQALEPVPAILSLQDLISFWRSPARQYLRHLGLASLDPPEAGSYELPLDLDGLQKWQLGEWLLTCGLPAEEARELAVARGDLPIQDPDELWAEVSGIVLALRAAAANYTAGPVLRTPVDVSLSPPTGPVRLTGSALLTGGVLLDVSYSSMKAGSALRLQIEVAALCANGRGCDGVLIRRRGGSATRTLERGLDQQAATARLETLLALRASGMAAPLPFSVETSKAYADTIEEEGRVAAEEKARKVWSGVPRRPGEGFDRANHDVWNGEFDALLEARAWAGWPYGDTEPHLFGQLARVVFTGDAR